MVWKKITVSRVFSRSRGQESLLAAEDNEVPLHSADERTKTDQAEDKRKFKLEDWKFTLYMGSIASILVLLFNVGFVLWAVQHDTLEHGRGTLFTGDCDKARNINRGFHLVINILGTALLGASNYGMQCLCAPTREDIDKAHRQGKWLDIGVPSVRNLLMMPKKKLVLWICLVLSSLPLHLIYNSTIFRTIASNAYDVNIGGTPFTPSNVKTPLPGQSTLSVSSQRLLEKAAKDKLDRLENKECISEYATDIQSKYGSLLLVVDDFNYTTVNPVYAPADFRMLDAEVAYKPPLDTYSWICSVPHTYSAVDSHQCSSYLSGIKSHPKDWTILNTMNMVDEDHRVQYCLSEKVDEKCKVHYSLPLAMLVIAFNFTKAVIICGITITLTDTPLLTTGDAVASFMKKPDPTTEYKCLLSSIMSHRTVNGPLEFKAKPQRWSSAVSSRGWIFCLLLYDICIALCIGLLSYGLFYTKMDRSVIWSTDLGGVGTQTTITANAFPKRLLPNTIIANTPQVIYSMLYFATNRVFTVMTLAAEWSNYALQRKGLRVSTPSKGSQRSTYFLSLPYRYAVPLLAVSAVLHWLISQSLFLVSVEAYSSELQRDPRYDVMTCGYSPFAIISTLSTCGVMLACVICMGFKRFKSGMPVAVSCSLAISAACHPPINVNGDDDDDGDGGQEEERHIEHEDDRLKKETDVTIMPLKWGVTPVRGEEVQHCTFSSEYVELPRDGCIYE